MFEKTRIKLCHLLLKKGQYLLMSAIPNGEGDFQCASILSVNNQVLTESINMTMETNKDIRAYLLARCADFLRKREIDTKYFIEEITK